MSLDSRQVYEFANFRLDLSRKVLLRDGQPVPLTPKVFDTLQILVENADRLIEKDELMQRIWHDHFVEESNLTSNIKMLRRALGDDVTHPKFIETVPKRGYRFIAEVRQTIATEGVIKDERLNFAQLPERTFSASSGFKKLWLPALTVFMVGAVVTGFWYVRSKNAESGASLLSVPFSSEKLSTNGKVPSAALSPDGKNMVYIDGLGGDKQSLWLRQLESSNNVEIIPPSEILYWQVAFSPDGNFIYFLRRPKGMEVPLDLYRIPIFGGIPTKILSEATHFSSSSDGRKISFVRRGLRDDDFSSLWIADADGKNQRKLASRPRPVRIPAIQISSDGKTVAFAVGQSENQANEFNLLEIDVESGVERELTTERFFNIRNLAWLPDQNGLLVTASKIPNKNYRIWQVSLPSGQVQPLTKDSESYWVLSLDKTASRLISTQVKQDFHLRLLSLENPSAPPRVLTDAANLTFAANGKIFFSSLMSGNDEIWSINPDGSGKKQLTNDPADDRTPVVSPAGNWIFFTSNRTGEAQVWRMNPDGSNQVQITNREGGYPVFVSPDGRWIYYQSALQKTLRRVSTTLQGEGELVLDKRANRFAFSPDGSEVAFPERQGDENILMIVSLADRKTVKIIKFPDPSARLVEVKWTPDAKNLMYILADPEWKNNILWFQSLAKGMPQQIARLGDEEIAPSGFAIAPDGKSLAISQGGWRHDAVLLKGLR